jgi:integrase
LKKLNNMAKRRVPMCPSVSKNFWTGYYPAWEKTGKGTRHAELTQIALRSLVKKPGRHSDGQGLFFRVLDVNKAYFVYRYRVGGKERETSLGAFAELSLAEAREKHAELRKLVRVDKIDPISERKKAKAVEAAPAAAPTFGQCADLFVETHKTGWRNSKHAWQWSQTLTNHAAAIRDISVDEVKTADILAVLRPVWSATPETGSRLRGRIEAVIDMARALGHIPEDRANVARWRGHLDHLLPKRQRLTRGHHKALPYADVPALMARLAETPGVAAKALQFLILTATRSGEALGAQWDEISFQTETWVIPNSRMKMGEAFSVPLSDAALRLLGDQMGQRGKSVYVFPGLPKKPLSSMAMSMLLRRMGESVTVHGFRTSFRTWCSDIAHVEFEVAESCLSHLVGNAVSRSYNRTDLLERRRPVMARWADYVEGQSADNVVALKGRVRAPLRRAGT